MSEHSDALLKQAEQAIRQDQIERARALLARAVREDPHNEEAWLALAKVTERDDQTIYCLRKALKINPENQSARRWLESVEWKKARPRRPAQPRTAVPARPKPIKPIKREEPGEDEALQKLVPRRRRNWPLYVGAVLFALIVFLAVAGPSLAPRDPLEENVIIQVNGEWEIPPFEMLTPGFPLGSDEFGRDLLSRLLWGIRPTMVMVLIVGAVRLVIGSVIGLMAGWSNGRLGRGLDTAIAGALSVPVLLVALGAIAVVGVELGIWAFIIGLSLTGWVETAQQVREQTRITKGQVFIEASNALGASSLQILGGHVLRQILPMMVMLLAFELSATLMTAAGLGFLGYYIGGDVWVDVDDFVARRISGTPELGQMLATSWAKLTEPWAMVAVGTTIFLAVLGFNLLGEGFRQSLNLAVRRRGVVTRVSAKANFWLDEHVWYPLSAWLEKALARPLVRGAIAGVLVAVMLLAAGRWLWPEVQSRLANGGTNESPILAGRPGSSQQNGSGGGNQATPTGEHEGAATQTPEIESLQAEIAWEFADEHGFNGGPVLAPGGETFYVASSGGVLYALGLDGGVRWQADLPAGGVGAPALGPNGEIYVSDEQAGLSAVSADGELLWHFQSQAGSRSVAGPAVASDGRIYYTVSTGSRGFVQAVSADGQELWASQAQTPSFYESPELSAGEGLVYLKNDVFDAASGELLQLQSDLNPLRYFAGEDGGDYLVAGQNVIRWQRQGDRVEVLDVAEWHTSGLMSSLAPTQVGVRADGTIWQLYTSPGGSTSVMWMTLDDVFIGRNGYPVSRGQVVDMDAELSAYVCGGKSFDEVFVECAVLGPDGHDPAWSLELGDIGPLHGGFWQEDRLVIATQSGVIVAIQAAPGGGAQAVGAGIPAEPGLVWKYEIEVPLASIPLISDGRPGQDEPPERFYLFSEEKRVYAIDAQGQLLYETDMPAGFYAIDVGRDEYFPPFPMEDGTLIVVAQGDLVYALDPQGQLRWQQALQAAPYKWNRVEGELLITDQQAGLYVFTGQGLKWAFHSPAGRRTAGGAARGPDGHYYYTVTPSSKGVVQAVSADGQGLWATGVETGSFYHTPVVSPDGGLVFLRDEIIAADTGQLLEAAPPVPVDEYLIGQDGNMYLRSGHTVMQWRYREQGIEVTNTISWNHSQFRGLPFGAEVNQDGLIGLYYRGAQAWIDAQGRIVAVNRYATQGDQLRRFDLQKQVVTECKREAGGRLACAAYRSGSDEPVWQAAVAGVPEIDFWNHTWAGPYLYVVGEDGLYKFYLGELE